VLRDGRLLLADINQVLAAFGEEATALAIVIIHWLQISSSAQLCQSGLTVNGRLVLQPILFHFFDSAFGRTVCPEKERHGFREITRIKPELRSCRRRREDETTPECARPRALQLGSLQTTEHFPTACPSHVAAGDGRTPLTQKFHFGIRDQIGENPCNPCQEFLVPALQRGGLSYLPAMQRLKGIFGTAMVLVIFAGGVWLGFTVPRWMKLGSGLHLLDHRRGVFHVPAGTQFHPARDREATPDAAGKNDQHQRRPKNSFQPPHEQQSNNSTPNEKGESARGLAHSRTLRAFENHTISRQRLGVRRPPAAFPPSISNCAKVTKTAIGEAVNRFPA